MNPIPTSVLDELASGVRCTFEAGVLTLLQFPTERELHLMFRDCGGKQLPHSMDEVHAQLVGHVDRLIPRWRLADMNRKVAPAVPVVQAPAPSAAGLDARIRSMGYAELCALCDKNGLTFQREGGNPGIRTMRARNTLYHAMKTKTLVE